MIAKKLNRKMSHLLFLLAFTLVTATSFKVHATTDENVAVLDRTAKAFTSVVKAAKPAVVHIQVEKIVRGSERYGVPDQFNNPFFDRFFGPQFRQHPQIPR